MALHSYQDHGSWLGMEDTHGRAVGSNVDGAVELGPLLPVDARHGRPRAVPRCLLLLREEATLCAQQSPRRAMREKWQNEIEYWFDARTKRKKTPRIFKYI